MPPDESPTRDARDAQGLRVAIIVSRYNPAITEALQEGALHEFVRRGGDKKNALIVQAPGAFELPVLAQEAAKTHDAVVALGCVIQGETRHDEVIADAIAFGLTRVALDTGVPTLFGVLTTKTFEQAQARSQPVHTASGSSESYEGKADVDNKGVEAMAAAIDAAHAIRLIRAAPGREKGQ